jgi:hypothetical protein
MVNWIYGDATSCDPIRIDQSQVLAGELRLLILQHIKEPGADFAHQAMGETEAIGV